MSIVTFQSARVLLVALALLCCRADSFGQDNVSKLLDGKLTVQITQGTLIYVLDTLAYNYGVPIGLEKSSTHKDEPNLDINIKDGSLKDVLDSIVQQYPVYRWEMKDGVINFTPVRDRYEFIAKLLDEPVSHYEPTKVDGKLEISNSILQLNEVINLMSAYGVKQLEGYEKYLYNNEVYEDNKVDLSVSNTNVRGVLNKIARDSKHKIWVVKLVNRNKRDKLILEF